MDENVENTSKRLGFFGLVVAVTIGVMAAVVLVWIFGVVVGLLWGLVKLFVLIAVVAAIVWFFARRSR